MHTQSFHAQWTRPLRVMIVLVCLSSASSAQVRMGPQPPRAELKQPRTTVPMDLTTRHPVVDVKINGKGPFRFIVDKGAGATLIDDDLARSLDLPTLGRARTGDASGSGFKEMPLTSIDQIDIGGAVFHGNMTVIGDLDVVMHDQVDAADGVLGFNTFAGCLMTLDYPASKLILEDGALPPADGQNILAYQEIFNLPTLTLTIAGVNTDVTLDSGAAHAGAMAADLLGRLPTKNKPTPVGMARRMNTATLMSDARIDGSFNLGRHEVREPIFHFMGDRSIIGYHIFKHFALTFDQKAKTVRFARPTNEPITIDPRYTAGFGAKPVENRRDVWYVLEGLPAAKAGLAEGDQIVMANGKPVTEYDLPQWRALVEKPGTVRLQITRSGQPLEIAFETVLAVP